MMGQFIKVLSSFASGFQGSLGEVSVIGRKKRKGAWRHGKLKEGLKKHKKWWERRQSNEPISLCIVMLRPDISAHGSHSLSIRPSDSSP